MSRSSKRRCDRCGNEQEIKEHAFGRITNYSVFEYNSESGSWNYDVCHDCASAIHNYIEKSETAQPQMEPTDK